LYVWQRLLRQITHRIFRLLSALKEGQLASVSLSNVVCVRLGDQAHGYLSFFKWMVRGRSEN
jgi:hypothetical protein